MIPDVSFDTTTAMLRFQSVIDLRRHLKKMLEDNLKELDKVGNITAMVMRDESIDVSEPSVKGWVKTGTVFVNKSDPEKATLDVLFAMVREIRPKVVKIQEALEAADKLEGMGIDHEDALLLYVKLGVPDRFIVIKTDAPDAQTKYELNATFSTR